MSGSVESAPLLSRSDEEASAYTNQAGKFRYHGSIHPALLENVDAELEQRRTSGPLWFLNPTRARFNFPSSTSDESRRQSSRDGTSDAVSYSKAELEWRARDNRKGRQLLLVPSGSSEYSSTRLSRNLSSIGAGIWRMLTVLAYWDVSWWIAIFFTVGCVLFVATGLLHTFSDLYPRPPFHNGLQKTLAQTAGGWTAFIGATLFAFGGIFLVVEATNEDQTGSFGWAVKQTAEQIRPGSGNEDDSSLRVQQLDDTEQQQDGKDSHKVRSLHHQQYPDAHRTWEWFPTYQELRSHYIREIGFLASFILAIGTIIFLVTGITSIPQLDALLTHKEKEATYWLTYLVGGVFFVASSMLITLESQYKWYKPNLRSLGWWIGFWNLVGSVGWTIAASYGYCWEDALDVGNDERSEMCALRSHITLLWASVAFLIGSVLLWYEALEKYPVERA